MKKFVKAGLIVLISGLVLTGCGNSVPSCGDPQIKETALNITIDGFKDQLIREELLSRGIRVPDTMGYEHIKRNAGSDRKVLESLKVVENGIKEAGMELKDVVTSKIEAEIKKCSCEANVFVNKTGKNIPVRYTAQTTDAGDTSVSVWTNF